jgi:high-affinity iron transporter
MKTDAHGKTRISTNALIAWSIGFLLVLIIGLSMVAKSGHADPTDVAPGEQSLVTAIVNSSIIVFREGLEAVLIFAAITASFLGARQQYRRPVVLGVAAAFAASVVTWFLLTAGLSKLPVSDDWLLAITGVAAIVILLLVMNWFFHKIYWTDHIKELNSKKRDLVSGSEAGDGVKSWGFFALGFSAVYREGFEVVLFLQNLNVSAGGTAVFWGVVCGLAGTAVVGFLTFFLHHKLPYKRMLVLTGVLLGLVLVVMVGGSSRTLQDLGVLPTHALGVAFPEWWARWFEVVPTYETLFMQALAAVFVAGSYYAAEWWSKEKRRRAKADAPAAVQPIAVPATTRPVAAPAEHSPAAAFTQLPTPTRPTPSANAVLRTTARLPELAWRGPSIAGSPAAQRGVDRADGVLATPKTVCGHDATTLCGCDASQPLALQQMAAAAPAAQPSVVGEPVRPTLHAPAFTPRPLFADQPGQQPAARLAGRATTIFERSSLFAREH